MFKYIHTSEIVDFVNIFFLSIIFSVVDNVQFIFLSMSLDHSCRFLIFIFFKSLSFEED